MISIFISALPDKVGSEMTWQIKSCPEWPGRYSDYYYRYLSLLLKFTKGATSGAGTHEFNLGF